MRNLLLTHDEFDVLYSIVEDTVTHLKCDLDEDCDDISDYKTYQIYQKLVHIRGKKQ